MIETSLACCRRWAVTCGVGVAACGPKPPATVPPPPPSSLVTPAVFTDDHGTPIPGAGYGWLSTTAPDAETPTTTCCADTHGRFELRNEYLPSTGDVSVYAIEAPPGNRYAIARLERSSPDPIQLHPQGNLRSLRGRVVDNTGAPLAAAIYLVPTGGQLSPIDRVLTQPLETDTDGRFTYRVTSAGPFDIHVATWDHVVDSEDHVRTRDVLVKTAAAAGTDEVHVLTVTEGRVVSCSLLEPGGAELEFGDLGIFLHPHGSSSGHDASCVWPGRERPSFGKPLRPVAKTVRFLWPEGSDAVSVTAHGIAPEGSTPPIGVITLKSPTDPCRMIAQPDASSQR